MSSPLDYFAQRNHDDNWLLVYDFNLTNYQSVAANFTKISQTKYQQLAATKSEQITSKNLISHSQSIEYLSHFIAAVAAKIPIFLGNLDWVKSEWEQAQKLIEQNSQPNLPDINNWIMIPTGGSSGKIRFAIHTWETLRVSVTGFQQYFQVAQVNSFCILPFYHVSGLMQFMRSFTSGGKLVIIPPQALELSIKCPINPAEFFISLVPTQLQRILQNPELTTWLASFHTVLLGGGPAWDELLQSARDHHIPIALTYGMTETASQVVALKPADFFLGNHSCGQVLPHAQVNIYNEHGERLGIDQTGTIRIKSDALALGYYPEIFTQQKDFETDDLGFFDQQGYLTIIGRNSQKIITGGKKVFPHEIEAIILSTNLVTDICIIGLFDADWGQAVTAVYVPKSPQISPDLLKAAIADQLSKYKHPKYWLPVERLPRNPQGKINRSVVEKMAIAKISSKSR